MRVDETLSRVGSHAKATDRAIPYAYVGPVIIRRNVDGAHVAFNPATIGPVGVAQQHFAVADYMADHGDMADRHRPAGRKCQYGTGAGLIAALIASCGLAPPCMGVAVKFDTGNLTGVGHALQCASGCGGGDQRAQNKRPCSNKRPKTADHERNAPEFLILSTPRFLVQMNGELRSAERRTVTSAG